MIAEATYFYNAELDIRNYYELIQQGRGLKEDFEVISPNFVTAKRPLLKLNRNLNITISPNISFDKASKSYVANEAGYIQYDGTRLTLFPFLAINEKATRCHAVVPCKSKTEEMISGSIIKNLLNLKGVRLPVLDENLRKAIMDYEQDTGSYQLLVEGKDPVDGVPEVVQLEYQIQTNIGKKDESGKINYRDKHFVNNVEKGDLIASYTPAVESFYGRNIFGEPIEPLITKPFTYKCGKNLFRDEETQNIYSEIEGVLEIRKDNSIDILEDLVIHGDVDLNYGNLDVKGNIVVKGNVLSGFIIKAKGSIEVSGNIEESTILCGKDLIIHGGINAGENNEIKVGGNLESGYINNSTIKVQGDITVNQSIMHSHVTSNGSVYVMTEKRGKIVGGTVSGKKRIHAITAGNINSVKTTLIAGIDMEKERIVNDLQEKINKNNDSIAKLKQSLGSQYFDNPKIFLQRLPQGKLPLIKQVITNLKACVEEKQRLDAEMAKHKEAGLRNKDAEVCFFKEAFDGVTVQIANRTKVLTTGVASPTRFIFDKDGTDLLPTSVNAGKNQ